MLVKDIKKEAFVVDKDVSLAEAAKIMSSKGIGSLLYVNKGKVMGIVTERDLLKNFNSEGKISKVMSTKVITIDPEDEIDSALELMRKQKVKRLPVVEGGKLRGIITLTDIAAHTDDLEEEFFF